MRSILSPLPGSSGGGSSGGGSSSIAGPRLRVHLHPRSKRKGKGKSKFSPEAWTPKSKGTHTFQKKFVLVDYMGLDVPRRFALKESFVLMRGILPEIEVSAEESVVRNSVTEAIKHCERTLASLDLSFWKRAGSVSAYLPTILGYSGLGEQSRNWQELEQFMFV